MKVNVTLQNKRLVASIEQTLSLLTKSSTKLIKAVAESLVFKILPRDFENIQYPAIYRTIRAYNDKRENVIRLSGLYSPLFGREHTKPGLRPFSLIVNVDQLSFSKGYIWYSPELNKAYRMDELSYYSLQNDDFVPYSFNPEITSERQSNE